MSLRDSNIAKLRDRTFDVLIIGSGINGAVSAAALSAKGVRTAMIDQGDFAGFTSQESSNLAWGGIKYMETGDFLLVRKLCMSRNHLMRNFPSVVREIRFLCGVPIGFRHRRLKLWAGAWLYWLIGNGFTSMPRLLSKKAMRREEPALDVDRTEGGFEYSDAYFYDNDARFVWSFVRKAMSNGCISANYVAARSAERAGGMWLVQATNVDSGRDFEIRARVIVNAAGPFVDEVNAKLGVRTEHRHVLSKGIHLIVDRISTHHRVLTLFASDGRLFFVIPMGARTCIGTTDTRVDNPYTNVTDEDRQCVLDNVNDKLRLAEPLTIADVIAERCGVRPLAVQAGAMQAGDGGDRDFLHLSRKHAIEVDYENKVISVFGGKLTDCINVGNEISDFAHKCGVGLPYPKWKWYGEPPAWARNEFMHQAKLMNLDDYTSPASSEKLSTRLWRRYGSEAFAMIEEIRRDPRQGDLLIRGTEYIRVELSETARREMVVTLDDFLRRRSKIALVVSANEIRRSPGLLEACWILFSDKAQARIDEYFAMRPHGSVKRPVVAE